MAFRQAGRFAVARLTTGLAFFLSCALAADAGDGVAPPTRPSVVQQMEGFNLEGYKEDGGKSWEIRGDKADIRGQTVAVTNVDASSYGEEDMNVTAKRGTLDRATGRVDLNDNVVITNPERGAVMKTDSLQWHRQEDRVTTEDPVTIEDASMHVQGVGLEARPGLKAATLKSDVMADLKADGKGQRDNRIQITSDGPMELDQADATATFTDNVLAVESSTGRRLKADRMVITFDESTKKIRQIVCTGNVEVTQDNNVTYADELVYRADEQRMVLTGRPKLLIDPGDGKAVAGFSF